MPTTNRQSIRRRFLRETYTGIIGTATGGAATTLVDTTYQDTAADSTTGVGLWLYRPNAASAADQVRRISTYTVASGTFTHGGPNYAVSPTTDSYELHFFLDPRELNECINRALSRCWYKTLTPLSLITDYDMETSGVTNWTATNATRVKTTGVSGFHGLQVLSVTASAANGYVQSDAVGAWPSTSWYMQVRAYSSSGDTGLILRAVDEDNTTIDSVTLDEISSDSILGISNLGKSFQAGSTVTSISLRLIVQDNLGVGRFDDVILHRINSNYLRLPTWVTSDKQIEQVFTMRSTERITGGTDSLISDYIERGTPLRWHMEHDGSSIDSTAFIVFDGYRLTNMPVYIYASRPYPSLADETTTSLSVDEDLAVAALKLEFYQLMDARPWSKGGYGPALQKARADFLALQKHHMPRLERPITSIW